MVYRVSDLKSDFRELQGDITLQLNQQRSEKLSGKMNSWRNRNLSSVPPDLGADLRELDLSSNFIRQLHALALPYLEQLDLSSNQLDLISEEAFENLARLEHLNLSRNELNINLDSNSKALQSLGRLKSLDISMNGLNNHVAELYLRNKSALHQLKITGNALTRLSHSLFRESKGLKIITIDNNLISEIAPGTFEPLSQLETLNLARNNLEHICGFKLYQVKYLNLSENSLEFFVTSEDDRLYSLEILDLSYNKLLYFPIVPKLNRLKYLHLQNNLLGTLNSEASMVSEANSLYSQIVREERVLKNRLHSNWRLMPLIYIDLSYNHFRAFPLETLSLLSSLETMNFSYNCLQNISWKIRHYSQSANPRQLFFRSLKHLSLQSNGLVHISPLFFKALPQIQTLNLEDNLVQPCTATDNMTSFYSTQDESCVAFENLTTLKHLNLKENNMKMLKPKSFRRNSLVSLNLAKNQHMVLDEGALEGAQTTLQSLILSEINMSSSSLSLPCMPALTHINISNNRFKEIPISLACSPLKSIDLSNNAFFTLNHSLIRILSNSLSVMFIAGNPFNCCDSTWLAILNKTIELPDFNETKCFTNIKNIMIREYLQSPSLYCQDKEAQGVHLGQMVIIMLFIAVLSATLIFFIKKLCCSQIFSIE
uniref:Leucine-rich repeat-containing protein 32-like n=1 Tax=Oryzias melastigma TaxID=30732 RepID=A0A3B3BQF2_ORYME